MSQETQTDVPSPRGKVQKDNKGSTGDYPPGCRPIAGMRRGWFYRMADRMIVHRANADAEPLAIGAVPRIRAQITHQTDDGLDIKVEYLVLGHRQRTPRIITEDELDRGTWAAKCGMRRPTGNDERHAFARIIREEGSKAPESPARTYYNEAGDLIFPDAEAQTLGYRTLRGTGDEARVAWEDIGTWTSMCGRSSLVIGAMFVGPALDSLDVLAHMVNCHGPGQQGKSTVLTVACACLGDLKPRRQQLMITWNSSKQGITQSLRQRGFLPLGMDEHSSSGRTIKESSREISQMVAGAIRAMGTADGSPRESDGFWNSTAISTSNEPLKFEGQTEDLASRLQEVSAPFFPDRMVNADGSPAEPGSRGAEHISKLLKRLAKGHGGWPLEWAIRRGMFRAENLKRLKAFHLELCAKYRPAQGGVAATIAELHMVWVVGAYMFGEAVGVPEVGPAAEAEAAARLQEAIDISAEANTPDSERLWEALDGLRLEASAFPEMNELAGIAADGMRKLYGFKRSDRGEWWFRNDAVRQAAAQAGIDNPTAALRQLFELGVHRRPTKDGKPIKDAQRKLPREVRYLGLGEKMHCFNTWRAAEVFGGEQDEEEAVGEEFPRWGDPGGDPGATGVAPENGPLTCGGATGATGATFSLIDFTEDAGATLENVVVPPVPSEPPTVPDQVQGEAAGEEFPSGATSGATPGATGVAPENDPLTWSGATGATGATFPTARMYQAGDPRLDENWLRLESKARGRTRAAMSVGVLGTDGLYLPNHEPVPVGLPGSVNEVPELMAAYGLKFLWLHASAVEALGLPEYDPLYEGGPQAGRPCEWAAPGAAIGAMTPAEGVSCWMSLTPAEGGERLYVAIPYYEDRMDRADTEGRAGFGGAPDAATLLDSLMVYLASTEHGPADRPQLVPYFLSPNKTGEDFAGGKGDKRRAEVVCEAIRRREVTPITTKPMLKAGWHRQETGELAEEELGAAWLHRFDKSAAYLGAYSNVVLGSGEPVHATEGREFRANLAGWWRLADVPGTGDPRLPGFRFTEAEEGGYWLSTPEVSLLAEVYGPDGWEPTVAEAWFWPSSGRSLYGMYDRLRIARKRVLDALDDGRPGAKWAKQVNGKIYQSFWGYLGRNEPRIDPATGRIWDGDVYWRPDWAKLLQAHAMVNTYRNLRRIADQDGRYPLSLSTDAVTYTADSPDPAEAVPASMKLGTKGGEYTHEGAAPMDEVRESLESGQSAHKALDAYIKRETGE